MEYPDERQGQQLDARDEHEQPAPEGAAMPPGAESGATPARGTRPQALEEAIKPAIEQAPYFTTCHHGINSSCRS
jgi:hypothetical protein